MAEGTAASMEAGSSAAADEAPPADFKPATPAKSFRNPLNAARDADGGDSGGGAADAAAPAPGAGGTVAMKNPFLVAQEAAPRTD
jgi:hypothetical protein